MNELIYHIGKYAPPLYTTSKWRKGAISWSQWAWEPTAEIIMDRTCLFGDDFWSLEVFQHWQCAKSSSVSMEYQLLCFACEIELRSGEISNTV